MRYAFYLLAFLSLPATLWLTPQRIVAQENEEKTASNSPENPAESEAKSEPAKPACPNDSEAGTESDGETSCNETQSTESAESVVSKIHPRETNPPDDHAEKRTATENAELLRSEAKDKPALNSERKPNLANDVRAIGVKSDADEKTGKTKTAESGTPDEEMILGHNAPGGAPLGVWISGGVATLSLVLGSVFGIAALDKETQFRLNPTLETADQGETLALVADLFFGAAFLGLVSAIVFYFVGEGGGEENATASRFDIAPVIGESGGGAQARWRF